jgi:hypothetical protein
LDLIHNLLRLDINSGDQDRAGIGRDVFYHRSVVHSRGGKFWVAGVRGQKHSDETRGQALAALLAGQGVSEVAKKYKLPKATVSDLKRHIDSEEFDQVRTKKAEQLAGLIEGHLHTSLEAARNIAEQTKNGDWLNKQSAEDLGVFYGILTDKAVRILEAAEAAAEPAEEEWPEHV